MDREADFAAAAGIEVGMRGQKCFRLCGGRIGKAIDIMVAVALGMADPDQRAERKILLHGETGLAGQVLAGDEISLPAGAPCGGAGGVDYRFVDALAGFRRDAAIA